MFTEPSNRRGCGIGLWIKNQTPVEVQEIYNLKEGLEYITVKTKIGRNFCSSDEARRARKIQKELEISEKITDRAAV